ncbi:unnamed protein product [Cyprideis torosa]|uniref:Uncharacterized protein n=1 Tax=Cyprideis torosa TaxID=163714 RepID=A0A7R8ZTA6_9CRUS|nr:unnamed protein product [Cyprideis torosa]CAG0907914.1 unnamed protein product [Cyprideis torosa]
MEDVQIALGQRLAKTTIGDPQVEGVRMADDNLAKEFVVNAAHSNGRILVLNEKCARESTGHGSPMPMLTHGGPGRAGGGEEMGGMRGVKHYMQRCAVQGTPTTLTAVTNQYQYGGKYKDPGKHPFRKYFEELAVGDTEITAKRTVTEADIVNFANVSWDHFYAHTDVTSLEGTTFEQRVAHGYFILSAAAGLFVDAAKGPVLLNYGIEECRFTKPVYAGMTIGVRLTVKEKIAQEKREDEDFRKGIVKFLVDVYDETDETVAIATILTMGKTVGGGVGLACAADYTMATQYASVKLSELAVGIGPFVVGPAVERKIGLSAFSQMAINATEWQTADWAKQKGMFTEVFKTTEQLDAYIDAFTERLSTMNPEAMRLLKKVFWQNCDHWDELLEERAAMSGQLVLSEFSKKAIGQFLS